MPRPASRLLALPFVAALVTLAGCGGGSTTPPAGLAYATNPATYTKGAAIAANAPTSSGGAVDGYAVTPALPAGLALNTTTGIVSGTPTAVTAQATYTVTAANAGGSTTASLSIAVNDIPPSGLVYTPGIATYTVGVAIPPSTPTSTGGAVTGYTVSPALPAGLMLDPTTGIVTGTPTTATPSALHVVTATNSGGSTEGALILRVNDVPPSELTYATNPATYTRSSTITPNLPTLFGGPATSWSVSPALPTGLSLNTSTGILSGTPTAVAARAAYTVTATNTGGSTTVSLSITVNDVAPAGLAYVTNPANYTTGTAIAPNTASSTGGAVVSYGVSPALPAGLSMNTTTGAISGTPTAVAAAAGYTVTATNTGGSTQATVTITVTLGAPTNLAYATNPASYTRNTVIAPNTPSNGGGAVVSYAVSPALPAGLALHPTTGVVSGTPTTVTATAAYNVTATNGTGSTQVALSITVIEPTLVSVAVSPASGDVTAGGSSLPLTARATYSDASTTDVTSSATWTTTAAGQVDVTTGGLASAPLAARVGGDGTVTASFGGQQGSATLRVVRGPAVGPLLGNDPLAQQQWYLVNTGQTAYSDHGGTAGADLRLTSAMGLGLRGAGVKVAVVDSGLEIAHPDLAGNVVPGSWNFVNETNDPTASTASTGGDHGTSVTGIIGMRYDNAIGGMGIASLAGLNGYNFLQNQTLLNMTKSLGGSPSNPTSDDVWIFNQSFGPSAAAPSPVLPAIEAQYLAGVTTLRSGKGALYVKSAGNGFQKFGTAACAPAQAIGVSCQNANMDGKSALPYNIVVGALTANGTRSIYSSAGSAIWVAAPGGQYGLNASVAPGYPAYIYEPAMVTTDRSTCDYGYAITAAVTSAFNQGASPNGLCDYTNTMNGTSSAAPATAGAIALLLDARPDLGWRDVKHILATTARRVDPDIAPVVVPLSNGDYEAELPWTRNAAGRWFHNWYGFGAVDVDAAVDLARTYAVGSLGTLVTTSWLASGAALGLAIPDDSTTGASNTLTVGDTLTVESIQIEVTVTHPQPGDLGLELRSPSGSKSILLNIRNGFGAAAGMIMVAESNLFYGEAAAGDWTVKVVDGFAADVGTLDQWKIRIFGH